MNEHPPASLKVQLITLFTCLVLLIVTLMFNAWLSTAALKKAYIDTLVARYTTAGSEPGIEIEYALKYGKRLNQFYGIAEIMDKIMKNAPSLKNIKIVTGEGKVLYDLQGRVADERLDSALLAETAFQSHHLVRTEGHYNLLLPIRDRSGNRVGFMDLIFDSAVVDRRVEAFVWQSLRYFAIVLGCAAMVLTLLFFRVRIRQSRPLKMKWVLGMVLGIIVVSQAAYMIVNLALFQKTYHNLVRENTVMVADIIKREIDGVLAKGVNYDELYRVDIWMGRVIKSIPEIEAMSISDAAGKEFYTTFSGKGNVPADYSVPLTGAADGKTGNLNIILSQNRIDDRIRDVALDLLTAIVTSVFLALELMGFYLIFRRSAAGSKRFAQWTQQEVKHFDIDIARPAIFLCYFFYHMTISFIPIQMLRIYQPFWGLPEKMVLGLPISMEVFCVGIAAFASGFYIDRKGWRFPLLAAILTILTGSVLSGLSREPLSFIASRAIVGLGFGICLTAIESYIAVSLPEVPKVSRFPHFFAGMFAGSACGVALGAMIADNIGFAATFFIAGAGMIAPFLFVYYFGRDGYTVPAGNSAVPEADSEKSSLRDYLGTREVAIFLLMIAIPAMLCRIGFLYYYFPLFGSAQGLSTANIGRAFMIYAICFVFLQPVFSRLLPAVRRTNLIVFAGGFLCVGGLMIFAWQGGILAAFLAVLMIGLADTVGTGAQNAYLLSLSATRTYGSAKSLGIYRAVRKIGETAGPLVFSWVMILGMQSGIGWIGAGYLFCLVAFLFGSRRRGLAGGHHTA
jgi:predicted MFS family arabinose efflux permease